MIDSIKKLKTVLARGFRTCRRPYPWTTTSECSDDDDDKDEESEEAEEASEDEILPSDDEVEGTDGGHRADGIQEN